MAGAVVAPKATAEGGGAASALILEEAAIEQTLEGYENAYAQLDAKATRAIWPSVDEKELAKAFAGLTSQGLVFDHCDFTVEVSSASAICRGTARFVTKVGSSVTHTEPRLWTFKLRKINGEWKIASVEGRRLTDRK